MERHIQDKLELIKQLSEVETDWKDEFSSKFLRFLNELPEVSKAMLLEISKKLSKKKEMTRLFY